MQTPFRGGSTPTMWSGGCGVAASSRSIRSSVGGRIGAPSPQPCSSESTKRASGSSSSSIVSAVSWRSRASSLLRPEQREELRVVLERDLLAAPPRAAPRAGRGGRGPSGSCGRECSPCCARARRTPRAAPRRARFCFSRETASWTLQEVHEPQVPSPDTPQSTDRPTPPDGAGSARLRCRSARPSSRRPGSRRRGAGSPATPATFSHERHEPSWRMPTGRRRSSGRARTTAHRAPPRNSRSGGGS